MSKLKYYLNGSVAAVDTGPLLKMIKYSGRNNNDKITHHSADNATIVGSNHRAKDCPKQEMQSFLLQRPDEVKPVKPQRSHSTPPPALFAAINAPQISPLTIYRYSPSNRFALCCYRPCLGCLQRLRRRLLLQLRFSETESLSLSRHFKLFPHPSLFYPSLDRTIKTA